MSKKVQFKLKKIKYTGKSIGDDIRLNIEMLDTFFQIDKRIKVGTTVEFDEEIKTYPGTQKHFSTKAKITVTEKDMLFNDLNSIEKTIKVDTENIQSQKFVHTVELRENRFGKNWGKSVAKFEITIEALSIETIRYVPDVSNGWLKVRIVNDETVSLPAFLKVKHEYFERNREYFTILEGPFINKKASVKLEDNKSWFLTGVEHQPSIHLKYSISKKTLFIGNKKYQATDDVESPWKKGLYDIELPDYPHEDPNDYIDISSRFRTWFRIGHKGERYLHAGRASLGCITITEIKKWNKIYDKLIKARKGDFMSVGVLEIVD